tara:strand:- start:77 stop:466 length:390 start_codon:yes stop_codon:yes gene_type:complete
MSATVVRTTLRLDQSRNAALFENTSVTAVGGSETTVLNKFDCALFNRYAIQIFNSDGSAAATAKVYGSLVDVPNASIPTDDWTQIGDNISVAANSNALKAISTTPIRHLAVTSEGNGADLKVYVYAEQV